MGLRPPQKASLNIFARICDILSRSKTPDLDAELFKSELEKLRAALEIFDSATMNKLKDSLLNMTQGSETHAQIKEIFDFILIGDHDEAVEMIDSIRVKVGV